MGFKLSSIAQAQDAQSGKSFEILQPGLYMAHIEKAEAKTASTGTEFIEVTFQVKDLEGNAKGRLWDRIFFTAKNMGVVKRFLMAADVLDMDEDNDTEVEVSTLANLVEKRDMLIHTKIAPAEGNYKEKAEVDKFGPILGYRPLDEVNKWYDIITEGISENEWNARNGQSDDSFMNIPDDAPENEEW